MQRGIVLQERQECVGQRPGIHVLLRVQAGSGAEHEIAHIVGIEHRRAEVRGEQCADQIVLGFGTYTANLQIAAVGQLEHAARKALRRLGDGAGLTRGKNATRQLDSADAAVQRLHDAQQARASAWARNGQFSHGRHGRARCTCNQKRRGDQTGRVR